MIRGYEPGVKRGAGAPIAMRRILPVGKRSVAMRYPRSLFLLAVLALAVIAGCGDKGGTTSSGAFQVSLTNERLETAQGNLCAVKGNATNVGNVRARVALTYEARNASGAAIGTATASFQVAPFSNFEFITTPFSNNLACSDISDFRRSQTSVDAA